MLYPLKFKKILKEKIWGGRQLEDKLNISLPSDKIYGESWEVAFNKNDISVVQFGDLEGLTLQEITDIFKEKLLGTEIYKKYKGNFPLLIKYLDINDKLSVQVHPNDDYALKNENEFGKSECWYVINASENAKIIAGLKSEVDKSIFKEKMDKNDFSDLFNIVPIKSGDFINIEPGMVHATLEGSILICEIQQNSDATYRIYDFDRVENGKPRPLHLDKASDVIEFGKKVEITSKNTGEISEFDGYYLEKLIKNQYFEVTKTNVSKKYFEKAEDTFKIYSILGGNGKILFNNNNYDFEAGDTFLIPANMEFYVEGNFEMLKSISL